MQARDTFEQILKTRVLAYNCTVGHMQRFPCPSRPHATYYIREMIGGSKMASHDAIHLAEELVGAMGGASSAGGRVRGATVGRAELGASVAPSSVALPALMVGKPV